MEKEDIIREILSSDRMRAIIGEPPAPDDPDADVQNREARAVRMITEGHIRHTTEDIIFKNLRKTYDV